MSIANTVRANAQYHSHLLSQLGELDYVPSALENQRPYIGELEAQYKTLKAKLDKSVQKTQKERKEHEAMRDSTTRRLAHKLTGKKEKFEKKASKEERDYVEALEEEMKVRNNLEMNEQMIAEAKATLADLEEKIKTYDHLKRDLADLYNSIFEGPTQEFPRDDEIEQQLRYVEEIYHNVQKRLNNESRVADILGQAEGELRRCNVFMNEALSYSTYDMFGGGGMADMMERNALSNAQNRASTAQMLITQARQLSPQVKSIGNINIAQG
ncbi:hypothetical protein BD626DRAFT_402883 [Schizophyllum amplum]|uniref:Uncharacterized protein n=1 Tax=Schizophyllum amplum TaxID=97359 RepID=A0A550CEL3_9AGAR|nr:hypothetical protein BD626DRAFT_402883 [Auriculariopsis ampla]